MSFKNLGDLFDPDKDGSEKIDLDNFDKYEDYYDKIKEKIKDDYKLVGLSKSSFQCWDNHDLLEFERLNFSCSEKGFLVKSDKKCPEEELDASSKYTEDEDYGKIWPLEFHVGDDRNKDAWYIKDINDFFVFETLYFESLFIGDHLFGSIYELDFLGSNQHQTFSEEYKIKNFNGELHTLTDEYLDVSEDAPLFIGYDKDNSDFEAVVIIEGNKITSKVPVIFAKDSAPFYFENATDISSDYNEDFPRDFSCPKNIKPKTPTPSPTPSKKITPTPTATPTSSPLVSPTASPQPTPNLSPTRTPRPPRFD